MNYDRLTKRELEAIEAEAAKRELWRQEAEAVAGSPE